MIALALLTVLARIVMVIVLVLAVAAIGFLTWDVLAGPTAQAAAGERGASS